MPSPITLNTQTYHEIQILYREFMLSRVINSKLAGVLNTFSMSLWQATFWCSSLVHKSTTVSVTGASLQRVTVCCFMTRCIVNQHERARSVSNEANCARFALKDRKIEITFLANASRFTKDHCFWEVSIRRHFVLLVRATFRRIWAWNNSGMVMTGEDRNIKAETCNSATVTTINRTWTGLRLGLGLRSDRLANDRLNWIVLTNWLRTAQ